MQHKAPSLVLRVRTDSASQPAIFVRRESTRRRLRLTGRSRASTVGLLALFVLLGCFLLGQAVAVEPPRSASDQLDEVGEWLRQGHRLEVNNHWDEALAHYEKAIRAFPNERSLKRRFDFTRMHFDVCRRLGDPSFRMSIEKLSLEQALDLYEEVLTRIQTHYVGTPHWGEMVEQGVDNFEVALSESVFVQTNLPRCLPEQINVCRRALRRELGQQLIRNRTDARAAVEGMARLAERQLGISPVAVVLEFACGATNSLDIYSAYLTPDQLHEVYSQIEGNFVGLGIELRTQDNQLTILRVIPHSPAEYAGIRTDDRILAIDGKNIESMSTDKAANLLQGKAGTTLELLVAAPGEAPRAVRAERRRVEVPSIDEIKIVDTVRGVGYLRLSCFQKSTSRDLSDALWQLHRQGMRGGLIVDLRSNPGGLLSAAVEAVDKFVENGTIVSTRGRDIREGFTYSAHAAGTWRVPLVVLIDHDSASAAEIFAGAIRDHRRGVVIGQRSYGKGSVQGIFPLHSHSSGIRLTTAKFYSPKGHPFSLVGVEPDIVARTADRPTGERVSASREDASLAAAIDQFARPSLSRPSAPSQARLQR
ncbi:MAG: PDZ domain-containing protein [Pirellulales bacterium]|nr:PDZ domain-containing protein [Pirellulales bacterium]